MKIGLMGAWNADSGASIHAELVGREWVSKGVDLKVFTFYRHSYHGTALTKSPEEEESYVTRCFTVYSSPDPKLETAPLLEEAYDIFVVEDLGMLPMKQLHSIFPQIKKKAKTVNIIHDGELSEKKEFFKFDWDHVVCFDERYYDFLKEAYPEDKLSIIPYPSYPLKTGDKKEAREKLNLPRDKKIVLMFGQAPKHALDTTMVLERLSEKYDIMLLLVTEVEEVLAEFRSIRAKVKIDLKIVEESPDMNRLYEYLYAADCMIYNKKSMPVIVVASTAFQCMGSGCPIVSLDSNFVYSFGKEVIKYHTFYELEDNLIDVFEKGKKYQEYQKALADYLKEKSAGPTADKFLDLFGRLLNKP
ncbi:MAG: glycosyltransferase [Candidatus Omnitrophota bacterium]